MNRRHTGLADCTCVTCDLIRCGAIGEDWDGWAWVDFAGWARVHMMHMLGGQLPMDAPAPYTRWAGVVDWFSWTGDALDFHDGGDDEL